MMTHEVAEIPIQPRSLDDLPSDIRFLASFGLAKKFSVLLDEGRGAAPPWLLLKPRRRND